MPIKLWNKVKSIFITFYKRLLKIRGQPREIALGFSLGIFIGMTPSMGFQTGIAVFFASLLKWNKVSSAIGVWISNPFTAPFIYYTTYIVGEKLMQMSNIDTQGIASKAWAITLGGAVIGLPLAVIAYYFCYSALCRYQENIQNSLAKQKEKFVQKKEKIVENVTKRKKMKKRKKQMKKRKKQMAERK
ncbi:DUF2062 domain-containing protein [Desulfobacterales bacterium HSG16]|nr:DUF2062 domain-containing protein [Desulfobacterales bacterium HSG16]